MNKIYGIILALTTIHISTAPGDLDLTFGPDNSGISLIKIGRNNILNQMIISEKYGFYSVGTVEIKTINSGLGRLTSNGILDFSFSPTGYQHLLVGSSTTLTCLALQTDNKILVGGYASFEQPEFLIARYEETGTLDLSFGTNGYVTTNIGSGSVIMSIQIQDDGKIVAGGFSVSETSQFTLARYDTDGTLDRSFGKDGVKVHSIGTQSGIYAINIQNDGSIVATGYACLDGANEHICTTKYDPKGDIDQNFANKGVAYTKIGKTSHANTLEIQDDGSIIVGGYSVTSYLKSFCLVRYEPNGSLDVSFNTTGIVVTDINFESEIFDLVLDTRGNIIVGGYNFGALTTNFALARYTSSGILDRNFGADGIVLTTIGKSAQINSLAIQPDGAIVAGGYSDQSIALARYLAE